MTDIKFIQEEWHRVFVKKEMITGTTDYDGNEIISEQDLLKYIAEGTTGDDEKDEICSDQTNFQAEVLTQEIDWWSDREGCTEVEFKIIDGDK